MRQHYFWYIFMDMLFDWFLKDFWKIFELVYCQLLLNISDLSWTVLFSTILFNIFWSQIKESSKVRLDGKLRVTVRAYFMDVSANNSLLQWKLDT